ncbi:platelet endothelial cell adhesion molecule isoform 2-T2 [Odontesthes bonariensis]|uniref:platelet endothelial cell adhesion molecule isoform X2 n=1 Tax=Odontesthes bonariensis TaxID=219752 RepID=UPI003F584682
MGPLLLLGSALLCSYFQLGRVVNAKESFVIESIALSIEPHTNVPRNTNVTLRCKIKVIQGSEVLSREYGLYKDNEIIYNKTTSSSEDFLYHLPEVRVSNNGRYYCMITIQGAQKTSETERLAVTGLSKPVLRINQSNFTEGEEISAWCSAPGESGPLLFYYYDNSKEIRLHHMNYDTSMAKMRLKDVGRHNIHCSYTVVLKTESVKSVESNTVTVAVRELSITPVLEISPQDNIYEGDRLSITCTVSDFHQSSLNTELILSQENLMLSRGNWYVNYSMIAPTSATHTFQCMLMVGSVRKVDTKSVPVKELFSVPTLTMAPLEVFQRETMTLTCRSDRVAHERLDRSELNYTLFPVDSLIPRSSGLFFGKALLNDFNYTCAARAKGIEKSSKTLTVRPKVFISTPEISVHGRVILGQPFQILCLSVRGSLPITYTLFKDYQQIGKAIVQYPHDQALFTVTVNHTREINKFICEANNKINNKEGVLSRALNATVIVPLGRPVLSVVPNQQDLSEGNNLNLICTVNGTPPITFRWYREGDAQPVSTTTSDRNFKDYEVSVLSKEHSGKYFCEAENRANNKVRSKLISIEVHMAQWKKALIWGVILLVVSVLVLVGCVLYFKSKRGKRETAAELSVKPSSPKSDDSLTVTLTHDTEVYNAAPDAVSFYDGKEGRVTNGTRGSMASLPADISNRSSYSIPATV